MISYKINLFDILPFKETYICLSSQLREKLFNELQSNKLLSNLSKELKIKIKNLSRYKNGTRNMTLELFLRILSKSEIKLEDFQNEIKLKLDKNGVFVPIGPFISVNENWVYIAELIRGDGHIPKNLWNITFVNKESLLINYVKKFFENLDVDPDCLSVYKQKGVSFLIIRSKILAYLFSKIFNIPLGKKYEMKLPNFIKNSEKFILAVIRGFFDAEGTITNGYGSSKSPRRIEMSSISKSYINNIKKILSKMNIPSNVIKETRKKKSLFRLYIYHQNNLRKFYDIVKPFHPKKNRKLHTLINSYDKNRIPEGTLHKEILITIKSIGGKATRKEVSNKSGISAQKLGWHLSWLCKNKFLYFKEERIRGIKIYTYYLTNKDWTL